MECDWCIIQIIYTYPDNTHFVINTQLGQLMQVYDIFMYIPVGSALRGVIGALGQYSNSNPRVDNALPFGSCIIHPQALLLLLH